MKLLERETVILNKSHIKVYDIIECLCYFTAAFVLSVSRVSDMVCPFAVSLTTVSKKKTFLFSAVGSMLGYVIFSNGTDGARYFAAVIIASLGALAIEVFKLKRTPAMPMTISALSILATGIVMTFRIGGDITDYVLILGESLLSAGGAFFFFKTVSCNFTRIKFKAAPLTDLTCVMISGSVLLMSLERITVYSVSPARIFAVFLILSTIRYGNGKTALTFALSLGFALSIGDVNTAFILGAYAFSTLFSTLFTSLSSLATGVAFTVSASFFAITAAHGMLSAAIVIECVIASTILTLLPPSVGDRISGFWLMGTSLAPEGSLRQSLVVRLRFASSAMATISENVKDVRMKIDKLGSSDGTPTDPIKSDLRMVAADQFFSIADMLSDLAFEFDEAEIFDTKSADKIRRMLGESGIYPTNISVIVDKFDRMRIEILCEDNCDLLASPRIRTSLSRIAARSFEKGRMTTMEKSTLLSFSEKPNFRLSVGFSQYCAEGNLCGDTVKIINDGRGHSILVISDGMGRGCRAALDGAMGAGLLAKLLSAGFGFDSSLKVVNSALLVKSDEESLATLDCASVDLFTGKCEFYKAGAPRSYVIKGDDVSMCELSSMPAGILRGIEFAKRTTVLNRGDIVVMLSDGITDVGEQWLDAFIKYNDEISEQELADAIIAFAKHNTDDEHRDDMSVIVARMIMN